MRFLAATDSLQTVWDVIDKGGTVALLVALLLGGVKRWWVFGWLYREQIQRTDEVIEEKDEWRSLALRTTDLAEAFKNEAKRR